MNGALGPAALHTEQWIFTQTGDAWCWFCGADPGADCTCSPDFHLARYIRARDEHRISAGDVIHASWPKFDGQERLTGSTVIPAPQQEATP